ncbi:putative protein ARB2BP [Ambystoma mexicanum]|uniref:putative protein ARB2BP n=1 Tax=Ambystoma mexicanum TaxID=8296 RepID=UPI0037E77179
METILKCMYVPESSKILKDFKYHFNEHGELRHLDTNEEFAYNSYKGDYKRNHKRYQVLGQIITQYVYELLDKACNLQKIYFPIDAHPNEPLSCFYLSEEALINPSSLIVLLQDQGVIRAGQWGQKAIIHHSLEKGTQIPFIQRALEEYGGVIVLNPNDNFIAMKTEEECVIKKEESLSETNPANASFEIEEPPEIAKRGSSTPEEHTRYVWDFFISKSAATNVAFIAHGYGGLAFVDLLLQRKLEIMAKVFAVAFIDSLHHVQHQARENPEVQSWILKHARGWIASSLPLDRSTGSLMKLDCPTVSAGTENHELTPSLSLNSIFRFLARSLRAKSSVVGSPTPVQTRSATKKKTTNKLSL